MSMITATRVAAIAIGLSLAGGMAFAAPDDGRGRDQNVGAQEQQRDGQNKRERTRRDDNQGQNANQNRRGNRDNGAQDDRRERRDPMIDRSRDRGIFGNQNDRRNYGDRNDRRNWGDRNRRQQVNIQQYRRNFNSPRRYNIAAYQWRNGSSYRRYGYGQHLPRYYFARSFWLVNFISYGLFAPPPGYVWVRYGPDALLIDEYTGEIVQVRYNMFY